MAFNLNKNDEAGNGSSNRTAGFNLSKQEAKAEQPIVPSSFGAKTWLIGLVGVIVVGIGVWYYSSSNKLAGTKQNAASNSMATKATEPEVVASTTNTSPEAIVDTLSHKIPVTFESGSSSFRSMDQSLIKRIISYLNDNPESSIQVNGYASSDGVLEINQVISQARADAFKKFLVSKNIAENRITAIGKGIENPIASNENNSGRKKNRRIEVTFP